MLMDSDRERQLPRACLLAAVGMLGYALCRREDGVA